MPFISKRALSALESAATNHAADALVAEKALAAAMQYTHDLLTRYAHDLTLSKDQVRVLRSEIAELIDNRLRYQERIDHIATLTDALKKSAEKLEVSNDRVRVQRSEIAGLEAGTQYQAYADRIAMLEDALERLASTASRRQAEIDELKDQIAELEKLRPHGGCYKRIILLRATAERYERSAASTRVYVQGLRDRIAVLEEQNGKMVHRLGGVAYRSFTRRIKDFEARVERAASLHALPDGTPGPLAEWGWQKVAKSLRDSLRAIMLSP